MAKKILTLAIAFTVMISFTLRADEISDKKAFKQAVELYEKGMFDRARTIFDELAGNSNDIIAQGYSVLCALRMKAPGANVLVNAYDASSPSSVMYTQIHYYNALNMFDDEDYRGVLKQFGLISSSFLYKNQLQEYKFKKAYSEFGLGNYSYAKDGLLEVDKMTYSDFTSPARYVLGYIEYTNKHFEEAFSWFAKSAKDKRFEEMSKFYMFECKFMLKDYKYVTSEGEKLYKIAPAGRKSHIARILSEAYLILGYPAKAKEYYEKHRIPVNLRNKKDWFYAGTLLYSVGDYKGAIENYSKMENRTDSLGQIANYYLGNSYIKTKNKVSAMNAFKDASEQSYDSYIQEDAFFNYAKLAFDLNKDPGVFSKYIERYKNWEKGDGIYSYIALAALVNRDYAAAISAYDKIDKLDGTMKSNYMKANYLRAAQLINKGGYRDAAPYLRTSVFFSSRYDNFNHLSRYWLAESYFRDGRYDEAEKIFIELSDISSFAKSKEGLNLPYNIAYCFLKEEKYKEAIKWFDIYLKGRQQEFIKEAVLRRADCYFKEKRYNEAIAGYGRVIIDFHSDVNEIYPYYQLGLVYGLSGEINEKIKALSRIRNASPKSDYYSEAIYELGRSYVEIKDFSEAVNCFNILRNNAPDCSYKAKALVELGMIAANKSDYNKALEYYKEVVENMPETEYSKSALSAIESIYQAKEEPQAYVAYIGSLKGGVSEKVTENGDIFFNTGEQIFTNGNYRKAISAFQEYETKYPDGRNMAKAYYYIAESNRLLGNKETACDYYWKVMEKRDESVIETSALNYSRLSYEMQRYSDAFKGYDYLYKNAKFAVNKDIALNGLMKSAFFGKDFNNAILYAEMVKKEKGSDKDKVREADYIIAKSYLGTSRRDAAFSIFKTLAQKPSTDEGAEASYMLIQDCYDRGDFDKVKGKVYSFAEKAPNQSYWLAKSFIVLGDSFMEEDNIVQAKATYESVKSGYSPASGTADEILDLVMDRLNKLSKIK